MSFCLCVGYVFCHRHCFTSVACSCSYSCGCLCFDWGSCMCVWQCCLFWFAKVHANFNPSVTVIPLSKHRCQVHSLGVSFSSSIPVAHEGRGMGGERGRPTDLTFWAFENSTQRPKNPSGSPGHWTRLRAASAILLLKLSKPA